MIKILVVEDEKPISDLIRLNLRKEGYECTAVYDGLDAIDMVDKEHFDLVLLDIMLPGADGFSPVAVAASVRWRMTSAPGRREAGRTSCVSPGRRCRPERRRCGRCAADGRSS